MPPFFPCSFHYTTWLLLPSAATLKGRRSSWNPFTSIPLSWHHLSPFQYFLLHFTIFTHSLTLTSQPAKRATHFAFALYSKRKPGHLITRAFARLVWASSDRLLARFFFFWTISILFNYVQGRISGCSCAWRENFANFRSFLLVAPNVDLLDGVMVAAAANDAEDYTSQWNIIKIYEGFCAKWCKAINSMINSLSLSLSEWMDSPRLDFATLISPFYNSLTRSLVLSLPLIEYIFLSLWFFKVWHCATMFPHFFSFSLTLLDRGTDWEPKG